MIVFVCFSRENEQFVDVLGDDIVVVDVSDVVDCVDVDVDVVIVVVFVVVFVVVYVDVVVAVVNIGDVVDGADVFVVIVVVIVVVDGVIVYDINVVVVELPKLILKLKHEKKCLGKLAEQTFNSTTFNREGVK